MRVARLVILYCAMVMVVTLAAGGETATGAAEHEALAPWVHPLSFKPLPGWQSGRSRSTRGQYGGPLESTAWIAKGVTYRSAATADPPTATLAQMPAEAVIVWAVISNPFQDDRPIRLDLRAARHLACCDGPVSVLGGVDELSGSGPGHVYSVIVRVYYGSPPTTRLRAEAQKALRRLALPAARYA